MIVLSRELPPYQWQGDSRRRYELCHAAQCQKDLRAIQGTDPQSDQFIKDVLYLH
jgi:hypothetical protein